jgi:hypothetical protein
LQLLLDDGDQFPVGVAVGNQQHYLGVGVKVSLGQQRPAAVGVEAVCNAENR